MLSNTHSLTSLLNIIFIYIHTCGSFQKFCTLYIFSLKMNLFYKIHLQAFIIISIVLYDSGPTFGQVLYSCLDAFFLMRLITRVASLDTSKFLKRFPQSGFFNFGNKSSGGLMSGLYGGWGSTCHPYFSKISDTAPESWGHARSDSSQFLLPFQGSVLQNMDHVSCQCTHNVRYWRLGHNCRENQNDCIILLATQAQCAERLKWPTYICLDLSNVLLTSRFSIKSQHDLFSPTCLLHA
jgi:hypothetical protein